MGTLATNHRYETLSEAKGILDPKGTLSPGTLDHNRVTEMILSWMAEMESGEVLRMSHDCRHLIKNGRYSWLKNWI